MKFIQKMRSFFLLTSRELFIALSYHNTLDLILKQLYLERAIHLSQNRNTRGSKPLLRACRFGDKYHVESACL